MIPIPMRWSGEAMEPLSRFAKTADEQFVIGQVYLMTEVEDRSQASHNHLFVLIKEAWQTLPEALASEFPSPGHLRKTALIRAGFCTVTDHVCASAAEAKRTAILAGQMDEYAIVEARGNVVRVLRALSMAWGKMKRADFQDAKDATLREIAKLTGIDPAQLGSAA